MTRLFRQFRDCTSGSALLETTIIFPLVLILMVGTIEMGRAVHVYHTADKSMRSAVRYLARVSEPATCDGSWGQENAKNLAVFGTTDPPDGAYPLIAGWDDLAEPVTFSFPQRDPECSEPFPDDPLVLRIAADIPMTVQLLEAIGLPSTVTIRVRHEERHIGQ